MLFVGATQINAGPWALPNLLKPKASSVGELVNYPNGTFTFATEQAVLDFVTNPDTRYTFQFAAGGGAAASKTASFNHMTDKGLYLRDQAAATQLRDSVFMAGQRNLPATFANVECNFYFQSAYMSGDQFAVGAALRSEASSRLILLHTAAEVNKAKDLVKFYATSCGLTGARLLPVQVSNSNLAFRECSGVVTARATGQTPAPTIPQLAFLAGLHSKARLYSVGGATSTVAAAVLSGSPDMVTQWSKVDPSKNSYWAYRVDKFLQGKVTANQPYVILWTRFSGKDGGAHPELDDSWTGLGQVIHRLLEDGRNIIVVGRPRSGKDIPTKLNAHLNELDRVKVAPRTNLKIWGEYWKKDPTHFNTKITGASRAAEYGIFLRMTTAPWNCKIVHLGMRSGAMDAAALLGMRTLFVEEHGNQQIDRTTKWTGIANSNRLYKRVEVSELPTATAKGSSVKGYSQPDVDLIANEVGSALA
ncbi:MAG: hypothetical protein R2729_28250 [Bryobacteraceae bacterium]